MTGFVPYLFSFFATVIIASAGILAAARYYEAGHPDNYLASLRENSTFGCSTAGSRRPEVFFMGDSHSYAAWNFNLASQLMGSPHISGCMMGAFYLETLPAMMRKFEENGAYPKKLIYGTSIWQFTDREGKQAQLVQHDNLLKAFRSRYNLAVAADAIRRDNEWRIQADKSPSNTLQNKLSYHSSRVEATSETSATALMAAISTESKMLWQERQKKVLFAIDADKKIAAFCDIVNEHGVELYVIDLPESPYMVAGYGENDLRKYRQILELFRQCSRHIVIDGLQSYGLGNRHYINRSMLDRFPYGALENVKAQSDIPDWQLYDIDHMNLVGATKFTPIALERLGLVRNPKAIDRVRTGNR